MVVGKIWRHLLGTAEDLFIVMNIIPLAQSGKRGVQAVMDAENKHIILLYQQTNGEPAAGIGSFSLSKLEKVKIWCQWGTVQITSSIVASTYKRVLGSRLEEGVNELE